MLKFKDRDKIVFIGDSVTDSGRGRPRGEGLWDGVGNGYVRSIDTLLNVFYPESLFHIVNMGSSGNTTRELLARWENDVIALKPDYVSLCIGFNDVWRQFDSPAVTDGHVYPEEFRANMISLIERTMPNVKQLILMTPYYLEPNKTDLMRAKMDEYTAIVVELAGKYELTCINLQKEFDEYLAYRHSSYIMWDRVHPGWIGSMIIARAFLSAMGFDREFIKPSV